MPVFFRLAAAISVGFLLSVRAADAQPAPAPTPPMVPGQSYALLIGGLAGQEQYGKWYTDWLGRFQKYLTGTAHLPVDHVTLLSGKDATFAAITAAVGQIAQKTKPQDQFILMVVGHGEINGASPSLTLAGPDPTSQQLASLLNSVPTKNQVVLNFSASSGDFIRALSAPGRVNVASTSPTELQDSVFPEFFLRGLESKRASANASDSISLLEAFNWAAQQTPLWIARWVMTSAAKETETTQWKASGHETVEIFDKLYSGAPERKLDPGSDRSAADAPVSLDPPGGQVTPDWVSRRVVDEHAMLEDCGQGIGVAVITDKGLQPVLGQNPGDPGYLASHTILGRSSSPAP